tara:strand:- start:57 stop:476 length:420 start_codon:yes stop_codon:yes gene_type:complete
MIRTFTAMAVSALILGATPVYAGQHGKEAHMGANKDSMKMRMDTNKDGKIDRMEFRKGHDADGAMFSKMDANGDGQLSREEYNDSLHSMYDADRDESLNETEYKIYSSDHPGVATRGQLPKPGDKEGLGGAGRLPVGRS